MVDFRKELDRFYSKIGDEKDINVTKKLRGFAGIQPGDITSFTYRKVYFGRYTEDSSRLILIVACRRGRGIYLSPRNNVLLSGFQIVDTSSEILKLIVKNLYKNRARCSYKGITNSLDQLLGSEQFRTFYLKQVYYFNNVDLKDKEN